MKIGDWVRRTSTFGATYEGCEGQVVDPTEFWGNVWGEYDASVALVRFEGPFQGHHNNGYRTGPYWFCHTQDLKVIDRRGPW